MKKPLVSVLMAVYNGEKYIDQAIESILTQTFTNFELLIVNDGSIDRSVAIINSYKDRRIHLVHHEINQGLVATRNYLLELAQGDYIATLDCDDISVPKRLATQVAFMERHPDVAVCGSWVKTTGKQKFLWRYPTDSNIILARMLFDCPIANSSSMIRRMMLIRHNNYFYRSGYAPAEDYDLWSRVSRHSRIANIPKILIYYRIHDQQTSNQVRVIDGDIHAGRVRREQIERLGIEPTKEDSVIHQQLGMWMFQPNHEFVLQAKVWLERLQEANRQRLIYPEPTFSQVLGERWYLTCRRATKLGWWVWHKFWESPLSRSTNLKLKSKIKFGVLCALNH